MKNLATAYGVQRKKKMAKGGQVNESAKSEARPMPDETDKDSASVSRNDTKKALSQSGWTDQPTVAQAQSKPRVQPIKHPKMVPSNAFSARLRDQESDLETSAKPNNGPQQQPPAIDNEEGADRKGPSVPALKMKKMAKGGMINEEVSMSKSEEDMEEHPAGLESDDDSKKPSNSEIMSNHVEMLADGGMINHDEVEDDLHDSIAAAIMAKKDRMKMAEGGQVDLDSNAEEQPNSYYHQNEDAALKENYDEGMDNLKQPMDSNEHGHELSDEDAHDLVSKIRMKMAARRQFSK